MTPGLRPPSCQESVARPLPPFPPGLSVSGRRPPSGTAVGPAFPSRPHAPAGAGASGPGVGADPGGQSGQRGEGWRLSLTVTVTTGPWVTGCRPSSQLCRSQGCGPQHEKGGVEWMGWGWGPGSQS